MQTIVLLHGALGAAKDLDLLAESLQERGLTVRSFSFSGHAENNSKAGFGIEHFTRELEDFILQNQLKNPAVFGYSMGGYVALNLVLQKKDLMSSVITLGTKFNWSKDVVEKETKMLNPDKLPEKAPAFAKLLEMKHGQAWRDLLVKTASMMTEIGDKNFLNPDALKTIDTDILIGLADRDQMVSLEETVSVFKTLPNAAMYMLPGSKHQIETADMGLLSKIIFDFAAKH